MRAGVAWVAAGLIGVAWAGSPAQAAPASGPVTEAVVAALGQEPILLTELWRYAQAWAPGQPLALALQHLIDERLLAQQAERYGLSPAPGRVQALLQGQALRGAPEEQALLEALARDKALAEAFVAFRFGQQLGAPLPELEAHHRAHRDRFPGPFAREVEAVRRDLAGALRAQRVQAFLAERRAASFLRLNPLP